MCVSGQACASGLLDALLHGAADGHKKSRSQSQERPQSWAVERKTGFEPATPILDTYPPFLRFGSASLTSTSEKRAIRAS